MSNAQGGANDKNVAVRPSNRRIHLRPFTEEGDEYEDG